MKVDNTSKYFMAIVFALFAIPLISVFAADYSMGTIDADTCSGQWLWNSPAIFANVFVTPNVANLQADSGWVWFTDAFSDTDSVSMCIYSNAGGGGEPGALVAYSDTAFTDQHACNHFSVMFGQQAIVQNDTIYLSLFAFGVATNLYAKLGTTGKVFFEGTPSGADDPWDTVNDATDANFALSFRLFMSDVAAAEISGRRRKVIILESGS